MGTNDTSSAPGAWTPTMTTSEPMIAASEYAGAVEASPITSESTKPIAFGFSVAGSEPVGSSVVSTVVTPASRRRA